MNNETVVGIWICIGIVMFIIVVNDHFYDRKRKAKYKEALRELLKNPNDPDLLFQFREASQYIDQETINRDMALLGMSPVNLPVTPPPNITVTPPGNSSGNGCIQFLVIIILLGVALMFF